jgi:16S rRNA G966 N2-methylase RsmD
MYKLFREKESPLRFLGKSRLGFYPLPLSEAQRILKFLQFPVTPTSALDPCVGDGVAFEAITSDADMLRYGIELDSYRAEQARQRIPNMVQGNALEVHCPVESFGLLYLNPPYDWTLGPADSRRTEQSFLSHSYRWLKPGGVLIFVIPGDRLAECSQILSTHFRDVRVYHLESPECVRYKQVVVIGARRSRREKERLTDSDITRARLYYASLARNPSQIPVLPREPEAGYDVPVSGPAQLVYHGLPLDEIEDMLAQSAAYRQAGRILFAEPVSATGRPLTPLHAGHVGLLACSGLLNGIFGFGDQRHIAFWQAVKVVDKTEEEEDGVITVREKERFSNELTLVYSTGQVAILK